MTFTLLHSLSMIGLALGSWAVGDTRWAAAGGAASLFAFAWRGRPHWTATGAFGLANTVTSLRVVLVLLLGALPDAGPRSAALVVLVFCLDGLDGWIARRRSDASAFGATFDMETDALFVLVAGLKLAETGRLGAWILVPGLLRYAYAVTISLLPSAQGEAPRSRLARYVFSVVVASFVVSFWPMHPLHAVLAAVATTLLVISFARSAWWSFHGGGPDRRGIRSVA